MMSPSLHDRNNNNSNNDDYNIIPCTTAAVIIRILYMKTTTTTTKKEKKSFYAWHNLALHNLDDFALDLNVLGRERYQLFNQYQSYIK